MEAGAWKWLAAIGAIFAIIAWDPSREWRDESFEAALAEALPPPSYQLDRCYWTPPNRKGNVPVGTCRLPVTATAAAETVSDDFRKSGWRVATAPWRRGTLLCKGTMAVRVVDDQLPSGSGRDITIIAVRFRAPSQDQDSRACRQAIFSDPPTPRPGPSAQTSPACAMLPEPLRRSCR